MKIDQTNPDAIVGRSKELAEERWPAIKNELDDARTIPVSDIATRTPLVDADEEGTPSSIRRLFGN